MTMTHDEGKPSLESLAHHGVKGMKWGTRRATIKTARANRGKLGDKVGSAEQEFLKARQSGNASKTAAARSNLEKAHAAEEKNKLTAKTLTRGEQVAALLIGGPLGAVVIGAKGISTRDSKKIKPYPIKILKNVGPEK